MYNDILKDEISKLMNNALLTARTVADKHEAVLESIDFVEKRFIIEAEEDTKNEMLQEIFDIVVEYEGQKRKLIDDPFTYAKLLLKRRK